MYQHFPKDAPGDFYTTGECLSCGTPEYYAPECLVPLDHADNQAGDTYFLRQPVTPDEIRNVCTAAKVCCVDAIRYAGRDPLVLHLLDHNALLCDHPHG